MGGLLSGDKKTSSSIIGLPAEVLEKIPGGYTLCEDNPRKGYPFVYVSPSFLKILGWSRDEVREKFQDKFARLVFPEDMEAGLRYHHTLGGDMLDEADRIYRMIGKNGIVWVSGSSNDFEIDGKKFVQGTICDITPYVNKSEDYKNTLLSAHEKLKAETRANKKAFEDLNKRLEQIKGLASQYISLYFVNLDTHQMEPYFFNDYIIGGEGLDFFSDLDNSIDICVLEEQREEVRAFISPENIRKLLAHRRRVEKRYLFCREDGTSMWEEIVFMKVSDNDDDYPRDIAVGFLDVDEEVRAELNQEYRQKRDLEAIQGLADEYATLLFVNLDEDSYHLYYVKEDSPKTLRDSVMAQDSFSLMHHRTTSASCHPDHMEHMLRFSSPDVIRETLKDRQKYKYRFMVNGDRGYRWAEFVLLRLDHDEVPHRVAVGYVDVDEEVRAEIKRENKLEEALSAAEAANEAKTAFLFNMSHDIRTPMNAIMGFRDLLEKHQDDTEKRADYLGKIKDASTVLLSIINNVLEMARIEKGSVEVDESAWNAEQFNSTLFSIFSGMMKEKGIVFTREIDIAHHYAYIDPIKLREIFTNILSNAYKYTPSGGEVHMRLEELPSERDGIVVYRTTISDNGIGMSEDFLPHIFEEFARENNTTDAKIEGTGLGMPIVKRLVELLGGRIEVESKKGGGTTFTVTIPHRIAEKSVLVEHDGVEIDPECFKGKRILLAEDNDLNAEIAQEVLKEAGFEVERAEDGMEAVEMVKGNKAGHYDLILMDIQMPGMNGYEATRAIRTLSDRRKAEIKIIAMTANAFEEDKRNAAEAGMNGHLAKPLYVSTLLKTLSAVFIMPEGRYFDQ